MRLVNEMLNLPRYGEACFLEIQRHPIFVTCVVIDPFKPQYQHAYSPRCSPFVSFVASLKNLLIKYQEISLLVIIYFILITCTFF